MDLGEWVHLRHRLRCFLRYAQPLGHQGVWSSLGFGRYRSMMTMETTLSGWRYWIEAPNAFLPEPVIGSLLLRPVEGEDIAIELCPGYAAGQAAQDELRLRIGEVVGDSEESQEIFDFTTFVLPDLLEARSTRSQHVASCSFELVGSAFRAWCLASRTTDDVAPGQHERVGAGSVP